MTAIGSVVDYVKDVRDGGLWYLLTGKKFPEWVTDVAHNSALFIYRNADYSLLVIACFMLLAMCGAKRCIQYIYWTFIGYILIKATGSALL